MGSLQPHRGPYAIAVAAGLLMEMLTACAGDTAFAPSSDPHLLLRTVRLSEHAYNMAAVAPYDTAQLHVTAAMADGTHPSAPVQYAVTDSALFIDASGILHVRSPLIRSSTAIIYAAVTVSGVVRRDSAFVRVAATTPQIPTRLVLLDADVGTGLPWNIPRARAWPYLELAGNAEWDAFDAAGAPVTGLIGSTYTSDTAVLKTINYSPFGPSTLNVFPVDPVGPGHAWMYASMYAYGKLLRDSIAIVVERPQLYGVGSSVDQQIVNGTLEKVVRFHPDSLNVPVGADVSWFAPQDCVPSPSDPGNPACQGTSINVDFDEPQYALASRIPAAYGTTPDVYEDIWNNFSLANYQRLYYNFIGGTGNIAPFRVMLPDTRTVACSEVIPINCRLPAIGGPWGGEARRFVTPGHYHYHSAQGASGVIVVE